jgi:hypothetical protein
LLIGHRYRWWVRGVQGGAGVWSAAQDFNLSLSGPTLQAPTGTVNTAQPTFTWSTVSWADSYSIWVNNVTTGQSKALYATGITETSWKAATALTPGQSYRWWVEAVGPNGNAIWSASENFTFTLTAPVAKTPTGSITGTQPTFTWDGVAWADRYAVWVDDLTTGQSKVLYADTITGTSWQAPTALTAGRNYRWWVQGITSNATLWSAAKDFTIPQTNVSSAQPSLPTPDRTVHVNNSTELTSALRTATPGTWILLRPGVYQGGIWAGNIAGTAEKPIVITAADASQKPIIRGGANGLQLSDVAHLHVRDLIIEQATTNGLNIDDGGTYATPSHHVTVSGLTIRNIGSTGNHDGIKLSGVQQFRIENCDIQNWGQGGSAIDMVGCQDSVIEGNFIRHSNSTAGSGIQAKGGSSNIVIRGNRLENAGARAIQAGGSTQLEFFRPQGATYEARDILVERNLIIGATAAITFVNVDGSTARFNTIYRPGRWVIRILQETTATGFVPSRNGVFTDNIVVFRSDEMSTAVNVGPDTAPQTFQFARNWWFCLNDPSRSRPSLPTAEVNGTYGIDPLFVNAVGGDFHLQSGSSASRVGTYAV